jgi:hypothetical protein
MPDLIRLSLGSTSSIILDKLSDGHKLCCNPTLATDAICHVRSHLRVCTRVAHDSESDRTPGGRRPHLIFKCEHPWQDCHGSQPVAKSVGETLEFAATRVGHAFIDQPGRKALFSDSVSLHLLEPLEYSRPESVLHDPHYRNGPRSRT